MLKTLLHDLRELKDRSYLLYILTSVIIKIKYRRSVLGFFWSLLSPLSMIIVMALVFSFVFKVKVGAKGNYTLYLFSGLVPWTFISSSLTTASTSIIENEAFIKKIYLPKHFFPMARVLALIPNFIASIIAIFMIGPFIKMHYSLSLFFLPISITILLIAMIGLAFVFSVITVYFRDFRFVLEILLQIWFYSTPILYPTSIVSRKASSTLHKLFIIYNDINPLRYFMELFQQPICYASLPSNTSFTLAVAYALLIFFVGYIFFKKYDEKLVFVL